MFRALSNPTRCKIVQRLCHGPATVNEIADPLPMTVSAVMQNIDRLKEAGLVKTRKDGRVRTCELEKDALTQIERWITVCKQG
jgi:DNA-binding transcriptional ArsR family regulator